jgi:hypothetical protein
MRLREQLAAQDPEASRDELTESRNLLSVATARPG